MIWTWIGITVLGILGAAALEDQVARRRGHRVRTPRGLFDDFLVRGGWWATGTRTYETREDPIDPRDPNP